VNAASGKGVGGPPAHPREPGSGRRGEAPRAKPNAWWRLAGRATAWQVRARRRSTNPPLGRTTKPRRSSRLATAGTRASAARQYSTRLPVQLPEARMTASRRWASASWCSRIWGATRSPTSTFVTTTYSNRPGGGTTVPLAPVAVLAAIKAAAAGGEGFATVAEEGGNVVVSGDRQELSPAHRYAAPVSRTWRILSAGMALDTSAFFSAKVPPNPQQDSAAVSSTRSMPLTLRSRRSGRSPTRSMCRECQVLGGHYVAVVVHHAPRRGRMG